MELELTLLKLNDQVQKELVLESSIQPELESTNQLESESESNQEDYSLVKDRKMKVFKPFARYGYVELISFALNVSKEIEDLDPRPYSEAM